MSEQAMPAQTQALAKKRPHQERGWAWWLVPKPFDLVSSLLYVSVLAGFIYNLVYGHGYPIEWWEVILMVCTIMALLSVDRLEYWFYGEATPVRVAVYLLLTRIILIEVVTWLDHLDLSPFLYLIVPFLACWYFGYTVGYLLTSLYWVAYIVRHYLNSPGWLSNSTEVHYLALFTIGLVFAITLARTVVEERTSRTRTEQLLAELEDSHQQLKVYSQQVAELATTKERNRLARDIHDSLGHYLTVINVQLEKALTFRERDPQEADQALSDAKRLAREALQDVRHSVEALRTTWELFSCSTALTALVEQVRSDQLSIDLNIKGSEEDFSKQILMTLYRAAQEGLTNIQKHAEASSVRIELAFRSAGANLSLSDNGCGFEPALLQSLQPGNTGGYGLQGVQERLELVGGCLKLESSPGKGTTLFVSVPKDSLVRVSGESL
jgi:signal transduction histidine kinase